jgi:excisionase family DNA binding protein
MNPTGTPPTVCYKVDDAARMLNVSRSTIYKLIAAADLASVKINNCRRIPGEAIEQLLDKIGKKPLSGAPSNPKPSLDQKDPRSDTTRPHGDRRPYSLEEDDPDGSEKAK